MTLQSVVDPSAGSSSYAYSYDLVGNRLTQVAVSSAGHSTKHIYILDNDDRLGTVYGPGTYQQTYAYDANGNTLTVTGSGGASSASYTWDPSGRMIGYSSGSTTASYTYDDAGNRTSETKNGTKTNYLNDPNQAYDQVLEEYAYQGRPALRPISVGST